MFRSRRSTGAFAAFIFMGLVAAMLLPGCGSGNEGKVFKVGVIVSLSGPAAPLGQPEQRSLELLEENINGSGSIDGGKIEFVIEDDESDPQKANLAATKLIEQENVSVVIGCSSTGSTLAVAPTAQGKKVPLVSMAAGTKLTQPVQKWLFSVAPNDALVIEKALMYMKDDLKIKKVAILHDSNAYGTGGADEFAAKAGSYGIKVVANESYGSADTDMTAQLTKIGQTDAQAILVWGTNPGPASIAKNMQQLGMTLPYIVSSGIANKKFIELAGPAANGVVFPASRLILPDTIPAGSEWSKVVDEFSSDYKKKYNMDIDTFAAHGWDAGSIVVYALREVGGDSAMIRDQIEKIEDYAGADGVFTYAAKNHAGLTVDALVMVKIEDGHWVEAK